MALLFGGEGWGTDRRPRVLLIVLPQAGPGRTLKAQCKKPLVERKDSGQDSCVQVLILLFDKVPLTNVSFSSFSFITS